MCSFCEHCASELEVTAVKSLGNNSQDSQELPDYSWPLSVCLQTSERGASAIQEYFGQVVGPRSGVIRASLWLRILSLKSFGNFAVYLLTARVQQNEEGRQVPRHSCFEGLTHNPIGRSSLLEVMMVQRTPGWLYSHLLEFVCTPPPSPPPLIWGCWGYTTKSTKNNILAFHAAVKMWRVTWFQHISTLSTFTVGYCWSVAYFDARPVERYLHVEGSHYLVVPAVGNSDHWFESRWPQGKMCSRSTVMVVVFEGYQGELLNIVFFFNMSLSSRLPSVHTGLKWLKTGFTLTAQKYTKIGCQACPNRSETRSLVR